MTFSTDYSGSGTATKSVRITPQTLMWDAWEWTGGLNIYGD
jgi:hypothetical protein